VKGNKGKKVKEEKKARRNLYLLRSLGEIKTIVLSLIGQIYFTFYILKLLTTKGIFIKDSYLNSF